MTDDELRAALAASNDPVVAERFFAGTLTQEALDRVIAAPRLACVIPLQDAHAVVGAIAGLAFGILIERPPAVEEALARVRKTWIAFARAAASIGRTADCLPMPELLVPIGEWVSGLPKRRPERPASERDAAIYSMLSSAYQHLFEQVPAATVGGPTSRFIAAFNLMMVTVLKTIDQKENGVPLPPLRWPEPTPANLAKKIQKHRQNADVDALFRDILQRIAERRMSGS